jgi:hypothetical protein
MVEAATAFDRPRVRYPKLHNLVEVECCGDHQTQGSPLRANPRLWFGIPLGFKIQPEQLPFLKDLNSYNSAFISGVKSARMRSMGRVPKSVFLKLGLRASRITNSSSSCHHAEPMSWAGRFWRWVGTLRQPPCRSTSRISFSEGSPPRSVGWLIANRSARVRPMISMASPKSSFWRCKRRRYSLGSALRIASFPVLSSTGTQPSEC